MLILVDSEAQRVQDEHDAQVLWKMERTRVGCRSRGRLPKNTRECKKLYNFSSLLLNYFRLIEGTLKRSKTMVSFF